MRKKVSDRQLAEVLSSLVGGAASDEIEDRVRVFVRYLAVHGFLHRGGRIVQAFEDVVRAAAGREAMTVETPYPLTDATIAHIQKALNLTNTDVTVCENLALLGGVRIRTRDRVFDASIATQLARLTATLVE